MSKSCTNALHASAVKDRGRIYLAVFRELSHRCGEAEAISVLQSASRAHGLEVGASLAHLAPRDFRGMLNTYFLGPDSATYSPQVNEISDTCLDVQFMTCPLKDGWLEMGCSDEEVCTLLKCATAFDDAVWEAAGFDYELESWAPGKPGCCRTRLRERPAQVTEDR
ncbi:L-2-amino-thiazoline-4-carboxylic acid hydrolase [Hoeflea prorocentri]|uniref:L-2-amino-thiazoline-4-carboxylic acid hydrolase n=1 Tax=Hoeflea prorocentri TaxID=1922333 RepID=A0A9X3ZJ94_9HYPH|nr:L-2-amino-thiazoline-4-carboxylic acid hydrolase [Hoeflea prorocentri]MCY6382575.1 L-2-amino-thiazoline-4-carboxylic acid hydrolase [Hoeflea prorocentri]MDA5400375.1 L-2-amino-thiazoline-4-carboxylic acid hydrolase [Hoeflea prorocentri]